MRKNAAMALLLLVILMLAAASGERESPVQLDTADPAPAPAVERLPLCSGDALQDGDRLRHALEAEELEAILACGAPIAARAPGYRWNLAHLLHAHHQRLAHLPSKSGIWTDP